MSKLTIHAQLVRGLTRLGYRQDPSALATRYLTFVDHRNPGLKLYVGRINSLRGGATLAASIPYPNLKVRALAAGLPAEWPVKEIAS